MFLGLWQYASATSSWSASVILILPSASVRPCRSTLSSATSAIPRGFAVLLTIFQGTFAKGYPAGPGTLCNRISNLIGRGVKLAVGNSGKSNDTLFGPTHSFFVA